MFGGGLAAGSGFWKNVRTKRTMRTKSVGRGLMGDCGVRAADYVLGLWRRGDAVRRRNRGRWLLAAAMEWPVYGMVTVFRSQLSAFRVRHTGEYFWACWGVRGGVAGRGKIRDGTGKTYPSGKLPWQAGAGSQGLKSLREN